MVYCTKCGTENKEDARFCVNCGAALYPKEKREKEEDTCFGPKRYMERECFGIPHGGAIIGVIIGVIIISWALLEILKLALIIPQNIDIAPFVGIIFGILIIAAIIYGLSRRRS